MKNYLYDREPVDRVSTREEIAYACAEAPGRSSKQGTDSSPCFPWMPVEVLAELDDAEITFLLSLVEQDLASIN